MIPGDTASPNVTSGVRIGLTSTAHRGFHEADIEVIAQIMDEVATNINDQATLDRCKERARALNPCLEVFVASARTGEGVGELAAWLEERRAACVAG